jgi:DNA-binding NarL/FixJ family response regulator
MKTRIMLVDDHRMFCEGLGSLIASRQDMESVGFAANGREFLTLVTSLSPDLVIMDVGMPEMNGIETVGKFREIAPATRIIALSGHFERHIIIDMLRAGATGYVLKESPFSELVDAIHAVVAGRIFISPAISGPLLMSLVQAAPDENGSAFSILTSRELEIVQAITEGKSTKEIASALSISVKTVETHRQQIMDKLDIHSIAELTKYAIREEITSV